MKLISTPRNLTRPVDHTEEARRDLLPNVNAVTRDEANKPRSESDVRADLEARYGKVYNTDEMCAEFTAIGFAAPLVVVKRNSDGVKGSLFFTRSPRFYYGFKPHG